MAYLSTVSYYDGYLYDSGGLFINWPQFCVVVHLSNLLSFCRFDYCSIYSLPIDRLNVDIQFTFYANWKIKEEKVSRSYAMQDIINTISSGEGSKILREYPDFFDYSLVQTLLWWLWNSSCYWVSWRKTP